MRDDEHHEAMGAMIHRGLVEERTNTRNYHREQKEALDLAINYIDSLSKNNITGDPIPSVPVNNNWYSPESVLQKIKEILK